MRGLVRRQPITLNGVKAEGLAAYDTENSLVLLDAIGQVKGYTRTRVWIHILVLWYTWNCTPSSHSAHCNVLLNGIYRVSYN